MDLTYVFAALFGVSIVVLVIIIVSLSRNQRTRTSIHGGRANLATNAEGEQLHAIKNGLL